MTTVTIESPVTTVTVTETIVEIAVQTSVTTITQESGGSRDALYLRGTLIEDVPQPPPAGTILASNGLRWVPLSIPGLTPTVFGEAATGAMDGVNRLFALSDTYVPGTLRVYLNGLRQSSAYITEVSDTEFELEDAPIAGDSLEVDYSVG